MAEDALEAIGLISGNLLDKLLANDDLVNSVMALTGVLALEMRGCRAKGIVISDVEMVERQMRARFSFDFLGAAKSQDLPGSDRLATHLGQEGKAFYNFIKDNPPLGVWMRQVIEKMETYAMQKGVKFEQLHFGDHGAFVDPGRVIVLEISE